MSLLLVSYGSSDENDSDEEDNSTAVKESHTLHTDANAHSEETLSLSTQNSVSPPVPAPGPVCSAVFGDNSRISDEDDDIEMHKGFNNKNNSGITEKVNSGSTDNNQLQLGLHVSGNSKNDDHPKLSSIGNSEHAEPEHMLTKDDKRAEHEMNSQDYHISDEEDDFFKKQSHLPPTGLSLPAPKANNSVAELPAKDDSTTNIPSHIDEQSQALFLFALPTPKSNIGLSNTIEESELEDDVKPKQAELLLKESVPKKGRKIVKITIPELPDSDDEDEPSKKKTRTTGNFGLLAMLPPPKNISTKETNRALIPHTLSKKPVATVPRRPPTRPIPTLDPTLIPLPPEKKVETEEEEGEEADKGNFFSLGNKESVPPKTAETNNEPLSFTRVTASVQPNANNEPLCFTRVTSHGDCRIASSSVGKAPVVNNVTYDMPMEVQNVPEFFEMDSTSNNDGGLDINDEQFIRLQGKRQRGREQIRIIDVHADDQRSEVEMTRQFTEETDPMLGHGHKKKDQPSQQEKRKHQITYLAFKAKEREFDLKNQWAEGRATRKQAQSKYGF